jgi:hypothetical protein
VTKFDWEKADEYVPDPGAMRGNTRDRKPLDELIELAALEERFARQVKEKLSQGSHVYSFEMGRLANWNALTAEIARRLAR